MALDELRPYTTIAAILITWLIFYLWKSEKKQDNSSFFQQKWTMNEVVALFMIVAVYDHFLIGTLFELKPKFSLWLGLWFSSHLLYFLSVWLFLRFIGQSFATVGLSSQQAGHLILIGLEWVLGGIFLTSLVGIWLSDANPLAFVDSGSSGYEAYAARNGWLVAAILYFSQAAWMAFFTGLTEEIEFRGLLYGALRTKLSPRPAMTINALCFMAAHAEISLLLFLLGLLASWLVEQHRSLIPAVTFHVGWNFFVGIQGWFLGVLKIDPTTYFQSRAFLILISLGVVHLSRIMLKGKREQANFK